MNFLDIANRHSHEQAEADPNVALMIVHPEERLDVAAMLEARSGVEVVHREPGLGPIIGPAGNFATLPDASKWLLCFGMLLGRLELFTVLILFFPQFWRG